MKHEYTRQRGEDLERARVALGKGGNDDPYTSEMIPIADALAEVRAETLEQVALMAEARFDPDCFSDGTPCNACIIVKNLADSLRALAKERP